VLLTAPPETDSQQPAAADGADGEAAGGDGRRSSDGVDEGPRGG
jgi:hypothetical protein